MVRGFWNFSTFDRFHANAHDLHMTGVRDLALTQDIDPQPNAIINGDSGDNPNLNGTNGPDTINGYGGFDTLRGNGGMDLLYGGDDDDVLFGGNGSDTLDGGNNYDPYSGDTASYVGASSAINANLTTGVATGQGTNTLVSIECVTGTSFDDTIVGSSGHNILSGGDGKDYIDGAGGGDQIDGGKGKDTILGAELIDGHGGKGNDVIDASSSLLGETNHLFGDKGRDTITGGIDDDLLDGGRGADHIDGGGGEDQFTGGIGADTMIAGSDADRFFYVVGANSGNNWAQLSGGTLFDTIVGFDCSSMDTITLFVFQNGFPFQFNPAAIDPAVIGGTLDDNGFSNTLESVIGAGQLIAGDAVLFEPDGGDYANEVFLIIDRDGADGYTAGLDMVIWLKSVQNVNNFDINDFI